MNASAICNDSKISLNGEEFEVRGSPTEIALLVAAAKAGITRENVLGIRTDEIPFSSDRKMMSVSHKLNNAEYVLDSENKIKHRFRNGAFFYSCKFQY
jgi:magnesium-transporting ATPase (P-type)